MTTTDQWVEHRYAMPDCWREFRNGEVTVFVGQSTHTNEASRRQVQIVVDNLPLLLSGERAVDAGPTWQPMYTHVDRSTATSWQYGPDPSTECNVYIDDHDVIVYGHGGAGTMALRINGENQVGSPDDGAITFLTDTLQPQESETPIGDMDRIQLLEHVRRMEADIEILGRTLADEAQSHGLCGDYERALAKANRQTTIVKLNGRMLRYSGNINANFEFDQPRNGEARASMEVVRNAVRELLEKFDLKDLTVDQAHTQA